MKYRYLVLGGDLRNVRLAEMLADDGNKVYSFGQDRSDKVLDDGRIEKCTSLKTAIDKAQIIIGPVPFSSNEEFINAPFAHDKIMIEDLMKSNNRKIFISGSIKDGLKKQLDERYLEVIDIMKRDDLAILNTIATAEGTIEVAIKNTDKILQGSRVLILGFGRVGKIVANKFSRMSALVTCAARKVSDLAWIKAYGYNSLNIKEFVENQERIDELVRKTEKNDSRNKIIFQSSYPTYNYNITNSRPILHHSSSVYKTQSPFYFSNNNSIYQVNKNIKYSLPITKYSVQPVKYKKPKIIYSSLTAKRSFEGDIYGKRQLNNLYNKYGMNFK